MKLIACIKQVPDTTEVKVDPKTHTLIRDGVPSILNPYDQFAIEECVRIRDQIGDCSVSVLTMGPPQARSALMRCLALGADEAILISDKAFAGSDTWATAYTLSLAIKKIGFFDIVFCGQQAIDGDTAQVGPELAQQLGIPQVTYVEKIEIDNKNKLTINKQTEDGYQILEAKLPLLLTLLPPTSFQPEHPPMSSILKAKRKPFNIWDVETLGGDKSRFGLDGSFTQVIKTYTPPKRGECELIEDNPKEAAKKLSKILCKNEALTKR
ncbi:MAG: electron transfer flavoprotein subunit beta/FixA family protein [Thermoplasmatales archaeon]|nr:MAG: electron transfer flavoprotein subunit beta/FixA family protein [Thermoplasmatales archaeon]